MTTNQDFGFGQSGPHGATGMISDELDRVLRIYEDHWRAAALEARPQFYGTACDKTLRVYHPSALNPGATCAWLIGGELATPLFGVRVDWRCPECGWHARLLPQVMIHLNNAHRVDWLWLATKFRDALARGLAS